MSGPCSVTKDHRLHPLTSVDAGTEAPRFELAVRVHVHKRLLSLSTAATVGLLSISATEYMYDGYRQTSCISSRDDDDIPDDVCIAILNTFPVDIDLYEIYSEKICSDTQDLLETAGEMNLRVEANICLWVDVLDEEVELAFAERMSAEEAEAGGGPRGRVGGESVGRDKRRREVLCMPGRICARGEGGEHAM